MNCGTQAKNAVWVGLAALLACACGPAENDGGQVTPTAAELHSQPEGAALVKPAAFDQQGVYLCVDANYVRCRLFGGPSGPSASPAMTIQFGSTYGENDAYSSIKIVGPYRARLFRDVNYSGGYEDFIFDDPNLADNSIGNDEASSMIIYWSDQPKDGVYLYSDAGYTGQWTKFVAPQGDIGTLNDIVSSLKIVGRYKVTLYKDANYSGDSITIDPSAGGPTDVYTLSNYNFNDVVSSLKVEQY